MRVYLDNSVLNRPFDDQRQARVWFETVAFVLILTLIERGECTLVWSPVIDLENRYNPDEQRRKWVAGCAELATIHSSLRPEVRDRALELELKGVKPIDALHIASAEDAATDVFLTCDDRLIRRYSGSMKALTPSAFIEMLRTL
jgi:predicted nucleic acid-binding protein